MKRPVTGQRNRKRRAYRAGRRAEGWAALWLRLKGYRVLARGYRQPVGEIDIVARRGATLAIVEVKRRPTHATALESVTQRQRRRIARAAEAFVSQHPACANDRIRFDLIAILPGWRLRHTQDAWRM